MNNNTVSDYHTENMFTPGFKCSVLPSWRTQPHICYSHLRKIPTIVQRLQQTSFSVFSLVSNLSVTHSENKWHQTINEIGYNRGTNVRVNNCMGEWMSGVVNHWGNECLPPAKSRGNECPGKQLSVYHACSRVFKSI